MKKRILFHTQHNNGLGHYVRIRQIVQAIQGLEKYWVVVGKSIQDFSELNDVKVLELSTLNTEISGSKIFEQRADALESFFSTSHPDIVVIEFFPFGRWNLQKEFWRILTKLKNQHNKKTTVICSTRAILGIRDKFFWARACAILNEYFDYLMVHSDPSIAHIRDFFPMWKNLKIETVHTGYVSQKQNWESNREGFVPECIRLEKDEKLIVLTTGGGADESGTYEFLEACLKAKDMMDKKIKSKIIVFAGNLLSDKKLECLKQKFSRTDILIQRFTPHILDWMRKSDVSISRAGYNTCMNILETGVKSILVPGGTLREQQIRVKKFDELGLAIGLEERDLNPQTLSDKVILTLNQDVVQHRICLDGAQNSARFLSSL